MNCDDWKAFFQDYTAGSLTDAARDAVGRHIGDCAACFGEVRLLKLVETKLRDEPVLDVPAGLVDRVITKTHPAELRGRFGREFARIAAAAVLVVGLGYAALQFAPLDRAKPLADTPKALLDAARQTVQPYLK